jgi:hypothetical protein
MTAYADAIAKPPRTLTELEQKLILKTTGEHQDGYRDHVLISLARRSPWQSTISGAY